MVFLFLNKIQRLLSTVRNDENGVTSIEYALLGICISAALIAISDGTLQNALEGAMVTIRNLILLASSGRT